MGGNLKAYVRLNLEVDVRVIVKVKGDIVISILLLECIHTTFDAYGLPAPKPCLLTSSDKLSHPCANLFHTPHS